MDPFCLDFPQTYFTLLALACLGATHVLVPDPVAGHIGSGIWEIELMEKSLNLIGAQARPILKGHLYF